MNPADTLKSDILSVGPHRVRHGNVMDTAGLVRLMGADKADIIYSDPPWGLGNLKFWKTMNKKMTGEEAQQAETLEAFLGQLFSVYRLFLARDGVLFVEYGIRWRDGLVRLAEEYGFWLVGTATPVYGSTNLPLHLHLFVRDDASRPNAGHDYFDALDGTKGFPTVMAATKPFAKPGGVVLDPCCGMGYSAQMSLNHSMRFRGNELNRARLQKTIDRLQKAHRSSS